MLDRRLVWFLGLTFALAWLVPGVLLFLAVAIDGFSIDASLYSPVYYLGVWSPAIAAIIACWRVGGAVELKAFMRSIVRWRCAYRWYLAAVVLLPGLYLSAALLWAGLGHPAIAWLEDGWRALLLAAVLTATAGPMEEIGWRGFALPLLQRHMSGIVAALLVGAVWGIWHLPVFLVGGSGAADFLIFWVQIMAVSVIFSVFFNGSGGCVPLMMLMHWLTNFPYPWEGEANLLLPQAVMLLLAALLIGAFFGGRYLGRSNRGRSHMWSCPEHGAWYRAGTQRGGERLP